MLDCRQQQAVLSMHASTHSSVGSVGEVRTTCDIPTSTKISLLYCLFHGI